MVAPSRLRGAALSVFCAASAGASGALATDLHAAAFSSALRLAPASLRVDLGAGYALSTAPSVGDFNLPLHLFVAPLVGVPLDADFVRDGTVGAVAALSVGIPAVDQSRFRALLTAEAQVDANLDLTAVGGALRVGAELAWQYELLEAGEGPRFPGEIRLAAMYESDRDRGSGFALRLTFAPFVNPPRPPRGAPTPAPLLPSDVNPNGREAPETPSPATSPASSPTPLEQGHAP